MKRFLIALSFLITASNAHAYTAGQFRISGLLGQVGLLGDPGDGGANALGLGASLAYHLEDNLALEMRYLGSSHSDVDHREISFGAEYYFDDYEKAYPHIVGGMSFLNNDFGPADISGDAVGIYLGGGLTFDINRQFKVGPEVRYVKAFSSEGRIAGREVDTVADNYSLLLRLQYILGEE